MGLIDSIGRLFRRGERESQRTTSDEVMAGGRLGERPYAPVALAQRFGAERDRRALVEAARKMYDEDTRVDGIIKTLARDATKGGFLVDVDGGPRETRAEGVALDLMQRLHLQRQVDDWFRLTLRDGDGFLELGIDGAREVVEVTRKPTLEMRRHSNSRDRFDDPRRAFWWSDEPWVLNPEKAEVVWFPEWMVVHARWNHESDRRYGRPLFASGRKTWKRVDEGELDLAVRRKARAGMRYVHSLPGADESKIEAYRRRNRAALDNPTAAIADFFSNVQGGIAAVQGDAHLSEIEDVVHHIRTFWLASPIPMSLLGYGQDLNRDVLREQQEQYDRALESVADWVIDAFVRPLVERQWLLAGILPDGLSYEIRRAYKKPVTAADVGDVAEAVLKLRATGLLSDEMLVDLMVMILPHVDGQEAKAALARAREEAPDEVGRLGAGARPPSGSPQVGGRR